MEGFTWWGPNQEVWGTEVPQWSPGAKPRYGVWGTKSQKLKQNVKLVYNFFTFFMCEIMDLINITAGLG